MTRPHAGESARRGRWTTEGNSLPIAEWMGMATSVQDDETQSSSPFQNYPVSPSRSEVSPTPPPAELSVRAFSNANRLHRRRWMAAERDGVEQLQNGILGLRDWLAGNPMRGALVEKEKKS